MIKTYDLKIKKGEVNAIYTPMANFFRIDLLFRNQFDPKGSELAHDIPLFVTLQGVENQPIADSKVITTGYLKTVQGFKQVNFTIPDYVSENDFFVRCSIGNGESGDNLMGGNISVSGEVHIAPPVETSQFLECDLILERPNSIIAIDGQKIVEAFYFSKLQSKKIKYIYCIETVKALFVINSSSVINMILEKGRNDLTDTPTSLINYVFIEANGKIGIKYE